MESNFDEIFSAAAAKPTPTAETAPRPQATSHPKAQPTPATADPWANLKPKANESTVRLNVDIPASLNEKLAAKAQELGKPKTHLVRELLKWALE